MRWGKIVADGGEAKAPELSWREGLWQYAVQALVELRAGHSSAKFRRALHGRGIGIAVHDDQSALRLERLGSLARLVDEEPDGVRAAAEADAADFVSSSIPGISKALPLTSAAIADPILAKQPLTKAEIAELRAVTVEDFSFVFGFRLMAECALRIGVFLLGLALREERFDDLWLAQRLGELLTEIVEPDDPELLQFRCSLLSYLPHLPVLSSEDATNRVELARNLRAAIEATAGDPPPAEIRELLDRSPTLEPGDLTIGGSVAARAAAAERLASAHETSGSVAYLEDLVRLHQAVQPEETQLQEARRLRQLALTLHKLGTETGNAAFIGSAALAQGSMITALRRADPDMPLGDHLLDAANFYLASLLQGGEAVTPRLETLRAFVPPLPATGDEEPLGIATAHGTRAVFELAAALEQPGQEGAALDNALAAAELAKRMLASETDRPAEEIDAVLACARVLSAVRDGREVETGDAAGLVLALDRPEMDHMRGLALATGREAVGAPRARRALQEALLAREPSGDALALQVELLLANGDLAGGREARAVAVGTLRRFSIESNHESEARSRARRACSEGALQLAVAGRAEEAAALFAFDGGEDASASAVPETGSANLCLLGGEREIALLKRLPGRAWELGGHRPRGAGASRHPGWLADEGPPELPWEYWLDALAEPLTALAAEPLRMLQETQGSPLVCLGSGLPLQLVSWTTPEISVRIAQLLGSDGPGARECLTTSLNVDNLVTVLGFDRDEGEGSALATIRAAGFAAEAIPTAGPEILARLHAAEAIHCVGRPFRAPHGLGLPLDEDQGLLVPGLRQLELERARLVTVLVAADPDSPYSTCADVSEIAEAFLDAGGGVVIATTGPTPSAALNIFTPELYATLAQGAPIDEAYAHGIESVRSHTENGSQPLEHPANWTGITLSTRGRIPAA